MAHPRSDFRGIFPVIISPPFLPSQASAGGRETDSAEANNTTAPNPDVCAVGMQECAPGNGAYPVSYSFGWHGGAHLMAPRAANGHAEPVRAIADGTVVFVRHNSPEGKPELQYRNARSDDGCVVIKHTTEIGDGGGHASRAKITYFSVYMHLQTVVGAVAVGKPIYRKDTLGAPGHIYGQAGQIHFEIVCDTANLEKLVGRKSGPLAARQGRTDAVYGDVWFKVPRGVKLFEREPHPYRRDDADSPPGPHASVQRQVPIAETSTPLVIRMRFGQSKAGDCTLTTFKQDGDRWIELGHVTDPDYEYNLYKRACDLNARYHALGRAHRVAYDAPAPSAIYEMLRFGRILGPDVIASSMRFGHWRKVVTPEGTGWINLCPPELNPDVRGMSEKPKIGVFSDADFPHWDGWSLVDDDTGGASLCESATIKSWLDSNGDGKLTHAEAVAALHNDDVKRRMSRAICRFPTEWSKQEIEARWGWLKSPHEALASPMTDEDFRAMKAHIEALAFWEEIDDQDLPAADQCWRFPPKAFVEHFRKCGWLTKFEVQQLLPMHTIRKDGRGRHHWEFIAHGADTDSFLERYRIALNKAMRKYGICSSSQMAAFFAQATVESAWFTSPKEQNGNNPALHGGWYGRGFLQLTVPNGNMNNGNNNYYNYFRWRGRNPDSATPARRLRWRDDVAEIPDDAAQSAGFYWVKPQFGATSPHGGETAQRYADQPNPSIRVAVDTMHGVKLYYINETARKVAAMVNVPGAVYNEKYTVNGMSERFCAYTNGLVVLSDIAYFHDLQGVKTEPEQFERRRPWK